MSSTQSITYQAFFYSDYKPIFKGYKWVSSMAEIEQMRPQDTIRSIEAGKHFVFSKEIQASGARIYCITNPQTFAQRFCYTSETHRMYHEHIHREQKVKWFMDVDASKIGNIFGDDEDFKRNVLERILIQSTTVVANNLKLSIDRHIKTPITTQPFHEQDFAIELSCSRTKYSAHLKCPTLFGFNNEYQRRNFTADVLDYCNRFLEKKFEEYDDEFMYHDHNIKPPILTDSMTYSNDTKENTTSSFITHTQPPFGFRTLEVNKKSIVDFHEFGSMRILGCHKYSEPQRPLYIAPRTMNEENLSSTEPNNSTIISPCITERTILDSLVTYFEPDVRHLILSYPKCVTKSGQEFILNQNNPKKITSTNETHLIPSFDGYDRLYEIFYELLRGIYDTTEFKDTALKISSNIKMNSFNNYFLIDIRKGPCLLKWYTEGRTHSKPNGLSLNVVLSGEEPYMYFSCQKENSNKRKNDSDTSTFKNYYKISDSYVREIKELVRMINKTK